MNSKRVALSSLFLAVALCIGVIENLVPPVLPMFPYVKIGFSNIVIIAAILILDWKYALIIACLKSVLVPLFVGNPVMIFYSLPSAAIAVLVSTLILYTGKVSIPVTSMIAAVIHNLSQLCVAAIMASYHVFAFTPYFVVIGILSGMVTGLISYFVIKYMPEKFYKK